jgi:hypothetical protein
MELGVNVTSSNINSRGAGGSIRGARATGGAFSHGRPMQPGEVKSLMSDLNLNARGIN